MNYCKGCGKPIHETAPSCPYCGTTQNTLQVDTPKTHSQDHLWMAIVALILGALPVLTRLAPQAWTREDIKGAAACAIISLVLGSISIVKRHRGRAMAIAGVVLGAISLLLVIGSLK